MLKGFTPSIMLGKIPPVGTGTFELFLDMDAILNATPLDEKPIKETVRVTEREREFSRYLPKHGFNEIVVQ